MATVTRKFRDDFETWAGHRIAAGQWTQAEMIDFKAMLRADLESGPDRLRAGVKVVLATGVEVAAAIDDHEERYRLWADFFSAEADAIRQRSDILDGGSQ